MDISEIRRRNLLSLIESPTYYGNRSAFGRAAKKDPNQINLYLTKNLDQRRNMNEHTVRSIEAALNLPRGWFDTDRSKGDVTATVHIDRLALVAASSTDLFPDGVNINAEFAQEVTGGTGMEKVRIMHTNNLNETLIVDLSVKSIDADGVYVLEHGDKLVVRRVVMQLDSTFLITAVDDTRPPERYNKKEIAGLTVRGKVVAKITATTI